MTDLPERLARLESQVTIYQELLQEIREVVKESSLEEVWRKFEEIREKRHDLIDKISQTRIYEFQIESLENDVAELRVLLKNLTEKLEKCETKIDKVVRDVDNVKLWVRIFTPTKTKVVTIGLLVSLLGGNQAVKYPSIRKLIFSYLGVSVQDPAPAPVKKIPSPEKVLP